MSELRRAVFPRFYRAHAAGTRFHAARRRFVAACAGRRGGKTQAGAGEFIARIVLDVGNKLAGRGRWAGRPHAPWVRPKGKDPGPFLRYAVVAPVHALHDGPRIALRRELGLVSEGGLIVSQEDGAWWLVGGVKIEFKSGDRPERIVGMGYDGLWCEEAARLKRAVWVDNVRPTLTDTLGWAIFTTTPLGKNWFWEEIWVRGDETAAREYAQIHGKRVDEVLDPEFACVAWTTADNTALAHLAEEMETARGQMPYALWARNYLASFDAFEGQCFDFIAARHVAKGRGRHVTNLSAGLDIGQNHPASASIVGLVDGVPRELWTDTAPRVDNYGDDAWRRRELGDRSTWANRIWAALVELVGEGWRSVPLHLPNDAVAEKRILQRYGFNVQKAFQGHEDAVTWMAVALHNDRFACTSPAVVRALTNLRYPAPGESSKKLWVDVDDDTWDGLRYALTPWVSTVAQGKLPTLTPLTGWGVR